ncbi:MAG: enoyl-[acyl-carrier protein] reductase [Thermomicrobiales bacterium]|nr:enoyl-[acyl-carrier protein] reductase [Thermomicrobiales bacterium]
MAAEGTGLLAGKNCVVMGVLNKWSIGWAIAEAMAQQGARVGVSYLDERSKREVDSFVAEHEGSRAYQADVESDESLDAFGNALKEDFGRVDCLVHSIGYAPAGELKGRFLETSREGFKIAHSVSVYSLIAAAQRVVPLMKDGGSIITLTYLGADRAFPRYNVMGVAKASLEATVRYLAADLGEQRIRVNALSAGPIKSAAARGIPGFMDMHKYLTERAPIKEEFKATHVGGVAVFLASDLSTAVTGETVFVDNGYHIMGM